jgi:hypothetical protein
MAQLPRAAASRTNVPQQIQGYRRKDVKIVGLLTLQPLDLLVGTGRD